MTDILDTLLSLSKGENSVITLSFTDKVSTCKGDLTAAYLIINDQTGDFYIGSSTRFKNRMRQHRTALRKGNHVNRKIQSSYNGSFENRFRFVVFPRKTKEEAKNTEQWLLDEYHGKGSCLNISSDAYCSTRGYDRSHIYKKLRENARSPENRERVSKNSKKLWRDPNKRKALIAAMGQNVIVDNVRYGSFREASRETGFSIQALRRNVVDGCVDSTKIGPFKRRVSAGGELFDSITAAGKYFGVGNNTMHWRVNSKDSKWKDFFYVN